MKPWAKIAAIFSAGLAVSASIVMMHSQPDLHWYQYAGAIVLIFLASYLVLAMLSFLFEEKKEDAVDTSGIRDGDVLYYYGDYYHGYSRVERVEVLDAANQQLRSSFAFADKEGEIVTKWFDTATEFVDPGIAVVCEDVKGTPMWNFLNDKCEYMLTTWVHKTSDNIADDKIKVFWNDGTINFVDLKEGKFMWKEWKKSIG